MRCLWITLADPNPAHNGQYVYSGGLISSAAQAGAELTVLGLRRKEGLTSEGPDESGVTWCLTAERPHPRWASMGSGLPNIAHRCHTIEMGRRLGRLLKDESWDTIVFDGISAGWALEPVLHWRKATRHHAKLVYVSHNHEESLRRQVADEQTIWHRRLATHLDADKVERLERAMVAHADLVTSITAEDGERYSEQWPGKSVTVLPPGYHGIPASRRLDERTPRRAVLVGSFDWIAKRMNLEEFVAVADPILAANGVELHVIGSADASFLDAMRRKVVATRIVGPVEQVVDHIRSARIAVVPERSGGGFKLKVLDYVFGRTPVLALQGSVAGVPLKDGESILLHADQESLALGIVDAIDRFDVLNRVQDTALAACQPLFDWRRRGDEFLSAVAAA